MKKSIFILAAVALLAMVSCNNKAKENQNQESAATDRNSTRLNSSHAR